MPYSSEQNGVAERFNRVIQEDAKTMLAEARLPDSFWGEAVMTANYVRNRRSTSATGGEIPQIIWTQQDLDVSHLRTFECLACVHVPKARRGKMAAQGERCIFLGYAEMGYRLYSLERRKIVFSRDTVFNETKFPGLKDDFAEESEEEWEVSSESEGSESDDKTSPISPPDDQSPGEELNETQESPSASGNVEHEATGRPVRSRKPPAEWWKATPSINMIGVRERIPIPATVGEAANDPSWTGAMQEEINRLEEHGTWSLVERPKRRNVVKNRWVYDVKYTAEGEYVRHRARLVAKGFSQKAGEDYFETYARLPCNYCKSYCSAGSG
eukprot:Plantae.Rhodophyta-Rhodochaete_pulchella.ctg74906.p1 GENE.Plantae.Rhodophyta-Rhodochaete_pulchella.ctg74906~~Plantae.Rhodophyta-Rhodochaete_pulchella.ctg74906.p1  ORF type:complete len:375 (-),score=45.26 Plantae.Rhodophyta-Rhodochaete_pulchella.ctg74906:698-1678(-)